MWWGGGGREAWTLPPSLPLQRFRVAAVTVSQPHMTQSSARVTCGDVSVAPSAPCRVGASSSLPAHVMYMTRGPIVQNGLRQVGPPFRAPHRVMRVRVHSNDVRTACHVTGYPTKSIPCLQVSPGNAGGEGGGLHRNAEYLGG